jgi:hypothetical protein
MSNADPDETLDAGAATSPPASGSAERTGVTLFIDPFTHHFLEDGLFDPATDKGGGDDILRPWVHLHRWFQDRGIPVYTADRLLAGEHLDEHNVYMSLGIQDNCRELARRKDVISSALFLFEAPIVQPFLYRNLTWAKDCFKRVYSFSDEEALAPFLRGPVNLLPFCVPFPTESVDVDVWSNEDRDFLVMINGNRLPRIFVDELYTERRRALAFFGDEIALYGIGWEVPPYRPYEPWVPATVQRAHRALIAAKHRVRPDAMLEAARRVWRGSTNDKIGTLGKYRFAICYENQILRGWITEKMFDCLRAGTVPVYWGAPDIETHVPADCFIDRRQFGSYPELREFLHGLSPEAVRGYREAGRRFLTSDAFHPFTKQAFTDLCADLIAEDTGIRLT